MSADDLVNQAKGLADKAQDLAEEHPEQVAEAADKLESMIDKATGGKFSGQIDSIGDSLVDKLTGDAKGE
jgi:hypothetical protein